MVPFGDEISGSFFAEKTAEFSWPGMGSPGRLEGTFFNRRGGRRRRHVGIGGCVCLLGVDVNGRGLASGWRRIMGCCLDGGTLVMVAGVQKPSVS